MKDLKRILATPKTGNEFLQNNEEKIGYTILDFWQWSVSDILSNATRGRFAEFIVGTSLGMDPSELRDEWDAYDLKSKSGIKIKIRKSIL